MQLAVSALNTTIRKFRIISINDTRVDKTGEENKDDIFFTMGAFEDFFIRLAEETFSDTSPNFTYESNQFRK